MRAHGWLLTILTLSVGCGSSSREAKPLAPAANDAAPRSVAPHLLTDAEIAAAVADLRLNAWYALYMAGKKAGWAQIELRPTTGDEPGAYAVLAHANVATNDDGPSTVELLDRRFYAGTPPFGLVELRQIMRSPAGEVEHRYRALDDHGELVQIEAGVGTSPRRIARSAETLEGQLLVTAAPPSLRAGQETSYLGFDIDTETDERTTFTVTSVGTEVLAGVSVPVVTAQTLTEGDSTPMVLRFADRQPLSITLGAGMRLELAEQARAQADVEGVSMLDTSVKLARPLGDLSGRDELTLDITAPDLAFPAGANQSATVLPDGRHRLTVRRGPGPVVTPEQRAKALAPTSAFDFDRPAVAARAAQIVAGATSDRERADRIVQWVYTNLGKDLSTELATASQVLDRQRGDCTEHTLLVVALARAAGLPARDVGGLMYEDTTARFYWHAWAQIAIDGRWVAVDGAWGQNVADVGHLAFEIDGKGNGMAAMGAITIAAAP
jgi:hypothetical protein